MKTVLIVCNEVVGLRIAGPAIRCIEIARILASHYVVKVAAVSVDSRLEYPCEFYGQEDARFSRDAIDADFIIIQGDALRRFPFLKGCKGVLVADLYCPVPLEYHQSSVGVPLPQRMQVGWFVTDILREQLIYADHFLCASERQKDFWLGALTVSGRINALRWPEAHHADVSELISLLPFGLSSEKPIAGKLALRELFNIPKEDFVLVWGGGLYQWFDPLTVIRAVQSMVNSGSKVHLVFIGVKHPNPDIKDHDMCAKAVELATQLGVLDTHVHFNFGWVDYAERQNFLLDADVGVSAHFDNPETEFSFRTRMLDYLWCGLPIVATEGDVFGDSLSAQHIGITVPYEDVDAWVRAINTLMANRDLLRGQSAKASSFSENFQWNKIIAPLLVRLEKLESSPDRDFVRARYAFTSIATRFQHLLGHVTTFHGFKYCVSRVVKVLRRQKNKIPFL